MKVTYKFYFMNIIEQLSFKTEGYKILNITEKIQELVHRYEFKNVLNDIRTFLNNLVPESASYLHDVEGPDDMPAHLKTLITNTNLTISVASNKLILGVWQGIYLCEWRKYGQTRSVIVHLLGE